MQRAAFRIRQRPEPIGPAPLASMAPVTPRFGERPTVASVVRRHLQRARSAAVLPCGHPANQPHDRFHPFHSLRGASLRRNGLIRAG